MADLKKNLGMKTGEVLGLRWEEQKKKGWTDAEIDGMTGFIFCNRYGNVMNAQSVNRTIKRISSAYNATEEVEEGKSIGDHSGVRPQCGMTIRRYEI